MFAAHKSFFLGIFFFSNFQAVITTVNYYDRIGRFFNVFDREITVLDLLNNNGKFYDYIPNTCDCCYVMMQKSFPSHIVKKFEQTNNTILLDRATRVSELTELGCCEYFDIVMYPIGGVERSNFVQDIEIVSNLGNIVIFCLPTVGGVKNCCIHSKIKQVVSKNNIGKVLYGDTALVVVCKKNKILTKGWFRGNKKKYYIVSNFNQKYFVKNISNIPRSDKKVFLRYGSKEQVVVWRKGINLWTYVMFNGILPKKSWVAKMLRGFFEMPKYREKYEDNNPWNFIISGATMVPIDFGASAQPNIVKMQQRLKRALYLLYRPPWHLRHIQ